MNEARTRQQKLGGAQQVFGECSYAAGTWDHERRVITKAEVAAAADRSPRDNARFVVTNLRYTPERVYQEYRERGDVENRIKELHYGLEIDRTSCHDFLANAFRVLLTAAAGMLFQALADKITDPKLRRAQVWTLREKLLKIAARVKITWREIQIHLPQRFPYIEVFHRLARAWGALPTGVT